MSAGPVGIALEGLPGIGKTTLWRDAVASARRAKRKSVAKRSLEEALAILEPLGAALWVARARDQLGRIGLRRPVAGDGPTPPSSVWLGFWPPGPATARSPACCT